MRLNGLWLAEARANTVAMVGAEGERKKKEEEGRGEGVKRRGKKQKKGARWICHLLALTVLLSDKAYSSILKFAWCPFGDMAMHRAMPSLSFSKHDHHHHRHFPSLSFESPTSHHNHPMKWPHNCNTYPFPHSATIPPWKVANVGFYQVLSLAKHKAAGGRIIDVVSRNLQL
ncbi:hypothetical protein VNO78_08732 [Psophocarpus tetragonolobus]|uniref:Uncharacterized protein n=1 Tax=Psophocarpus tetragonolobus TaxID=3891 RepID=A0AAN9SYG6_PSOTE